MIVTIVTYPAKPIDADAQRELLERVAPRFQTIPGLVRKYFIRDGQQGGGVYVWQNRASAEAYLDDAWSQRMAENYGGVPQVAYFDCPALVDNQRHAIDFF